MISGPVVAPRSGGQPRQLIVLLHGYGADGEDLIGLAGPWGETFPDALIAAPNAPTRCAQNPFGFEWFPLDFDDMAESLRVGAPLVRGVVVDYLAQTWSLTGLGPGDTFLTGFSQGAMMALHAGLSIPGPLLGIVSFSGALMPPEVFAAPRPPVCLVHGDLDGVVNPALTQQAASELTVRGCSVSVHISQGMAHGISPDGLDFATSFMRARLAASTD